MGALANSVLDPATGGPGTGGWMSTHRPTAPDWPVVLFRHPPACGALQDCLGAEVARPARVEKDPQGRLYLAAEVCQLRTPSGPAVPVVPPGPHALSSTSRTPTSCRPSSAALCVGHLSGEWYTSRLRFRLHTQHSSPAPSPGSELCGTHDWLKSPPLLTIIKQIAAMLCHILVRASLTVGRRTSS